MYCSVSLKDTTPCFSTLNRWSFCMHIIQGTKNLVILKCCFKSCITSYWTAIRLLLLTLWLLIRRYRLMALSDTLTSSASRRFNLHKYTWYHFRVWSPNIDMKIFQREGLQRLYSELGYKSCIQLSVAWLVELSGVSIQVVLGRDSASQPQHFTYQPTVICEKVNCLTQREWNINDLLFQPTIFAGAFLLFLGLSRIWI